MPLISDGFNEEHIPRTKYYHILGDFAKLRDMYDKAKMVYGLHEEMLFGEKYYIIQIESGDQPLGVEVFGNSGYSVAHYFNEQGELVKIHTGVTLHFS